MLKETASAILQEPVKFKISGTVRHWLFRWKQSSVTRKFEVRPLTIGSIIRISKLVMDIDPDLLRKGSLLESTYIAAEKHARNLARVVAIGVTNSRVEPSESLVRFIEDNLTASQLSEIVNVIILQMDVRSFMTSIVSIRGMNLLTMKTNPEDQRSPVASGDKSAE